MLWIPIIRTSLLISLSILFVVALYRRFKQKTIADHMPVPLHAELISIEVAYHPARAQVLVKVPRQQELHTSLLNDRHEAVHSWPTQVVDMGEHVIERSLTDAPDGVYFLELSTATQRTVRQFRLQGTLPHEVALT